MGAALEVGAGAYMPLMGQERGVRPVLCWEGASVVVRDPPRELKTDDMWEPRSRLAQGRWIDHWTARLCGRSSPRWSGRWDPQFVQLSKVVCGADKKVDRAFEGRTMGASRAEAVWARWGMCEWTTDGGLAVP